MTAEQTTKSVLELRATSGPTAVSFLLQPPGPLIIGRRSVSALQLNDPAVSRDHARLSFRPAIGDGDQSHVEWFIDDMGSVHGTTLNGVRIKSNRQYHLRASDLIGIGPWTFHVVDRSRPSKPGTTLATVSDTTPAAALVSRVESRSRDLMSYEHLQLLQQCSERIHGAQTEQAVAEAVLDAATAGTDFTTLALLRPLASDEQIEVIASRGDALGEQLSSQLNGALIRDAAAGDPARLHNVPSAESRAAPSGRTERRTAETLCLPVMVESTVLALLYLDHPKRDSKPAQTDGPDESFLLGVARLTALGLANLMRMDVERRQERMEVELRAAAEAKRWLLPPRQGKDGPFTYVGETRQGQSVGGDFFDIIPLARERLAVVIGEVDGKGIPASILVSATQGFLHACLEERGDPLLAVTHVDRLYQSRIAHSRILKLWVGVFDAQERVLTYVCAGHRCAMTLSEDGRYEALTKGDLPPVGVEGDTPYQAQKTVLAPNQRTLLLSDGFIQQQACDRNVAAGNDATTSDSDEPERFGAERARDYLKGVSPDEDEIAALFRALERHAGTNVFSNDATAVIIRS